MSKSAIKSIIRVLFLLFWCIIIILILLFFTLNYAIKSLSNISIMGLSASYSISFNKHFVLNIENPTLNGIPIASNAHLHFDSIKIGNPTNISNHLYIDSPSYNAGEMYLNAKSIDANINYEISKQDENFNIVIKLADINGNRINYKDEKNRKFIKNMKVRILDNITLPIKPNNKNFHIKLRTESLDIKDSLNYTELSPINMHLYINNDTVKALIDINSIKSGSYSIEMININATQHPSSLDFSISSPKTKFGSDLNISKISISGSYTTQKISFKSASFNIFNGEAFIAPFNINLKNNKFLSSIYFENIELEKIQQLIGDPKLKLEGKLFGNIKITDSKKMPFMISSGTISNRDQPGILKYNLKTDSKYTKMLTQTLEDFRYKSIHGNLHGVGDILNIELLIRGYNPNFEQGRAIEFNLNVEENLYNLYRSLTYKAQG